MPSLVNNETSSDKTIIKLSYEPLDASTAIASVTSTDCGAISMFLGTTRSDIIDGQSVSSLYYEAYESMAVKVMSSLCDEVRRLYPIKNLLLIHRLGQVKVKEASIIVISVGAHRQETLKATEWLINEVKSKVPIWKKEQFNDGSEEWKENKEVFWLK